MLLGRIGLEEKQWTLITSLDRKSRIVSEIFCAIFLHVPGRTIHQRGGEDGVEGTRHYQQHGWERGMGEGEIGGGPSGSL